MLKDIILTHAQAPHISWRTACKWFLTNSVQYVVILIKLSGFYNILIFFYTFNFRNIFSHFEFHEVKIYLSFSLQMKYINKYASLSINKILGDFQAAFQKIKCLPKSSIITIWYFFLQIPKIESMFSFFLPMTKCALWSRSGRP